MKSLPARTCSSLLERPIQSSQMLRCAASTTSSNASSVAQLRAVVVDMRVISRGDNTQGGDSIQSLFKQVCFEVDQLNVFLVMMV